MNFSSNTKFNVSNCSECAALNKAADIGSDINNLEMHTTKLDKKPNKTIEISVFNRCDNCKVTTKGIKTTSDKN